MFYHMTWFFMSALMPQQNCSMKKGQNYSPLKCYLSREDQIWYVLFLPETRLWGLSASVEYMPCIISSYLSHDPISNPSQKKNQKI